MQPSQETFDDSLRDLIINRNDIIRQLCDSDTGFFRRRHLLQALEFTDYTINELTRNNPDSFDEMADAVNKMKDNL